MMEERANIKFCVKYGKTFTETLAILKKYIECPKNIGTPEYLEKYKFYRKVFQTKAVRFKKIYLLILSV